MRRLLLMCLALLFGVLNAVAQDRTVTGRVTDQSTGEGLPGVTVLVKGTSVGASTGGDGSFSLNAPASATTLVFSYIGYGTQERPITDAPITVALATDAKQLGEVVVTALGVERNRNSLAYSATQIEGGDITVARNPNAVNSLSGKIAGLNIQQTNTLGGSTNVVIRGNKSLFGNNQALFVIDGVPISNDNTNTRDQKTGRSGYDYGNAAADINPDDIATTTVLKGAAATALYGERAANGVILITTKKGRKGLGVTLNSGITVGKFDPHTFIKYQKKYGAGYGRYYGPDEDANFNQDANGNLVVPTSEDASYGAPFDPNLMVYQWGAYTPGSPTFGKKTPWVAAKNDPSTFFETAVSTLNSVSLDGGNDNGTFKLGYTNNVERGVLPNSRVTKDIINFGASLNMTSKLTISATANFTRISGLGRYGTGYGSENLMTNFRQWWQTNVDIKELKEAYERDHTNATWNFQQPEIGKFAAIYWNNPYFVRYQNYEQDRRFRTYGNAMANYKVTDWFSVMGRVTLDTYDEQQEERSAKGSTLSSYPSYYSRFNRTYREANFDLIGNFKKQFSEDFSIQGLIGSNMRRQYIKSIRAITNGGLAVPDLYSLTNTVSPLVSPVETDVSIGVDGLFASATFGFRDRIYLDLTARRDKSTTLRKGNNAFTYPSASLGYVFSEDLRETAPWLSYGKLRVNYAEVGQGATAQSTNDYYLQRPGIGNAAISSIPSTKNNPDLKPERTKSSEAGIDLAFLDNRLGLEVTYYQQNTQDQIIPLRISTATGYDSRYVNSGEVRNRGFEVQGFVTPVKNENFSWTLRANWTRNRNEVISLFNGVDNIVLADYQGGVSSNATVGQAFGTLRGSDFIYTNGKRTVGANGRYLFSDPNQVIADPNPKWRGGVTNVVTYKSISLNFLVDIRQGGQVFSLDRYYGLATGLQPETADKNDLGNESRLPIGEGGGIILDAVMADGSPNTKRVSNTNFGIYGYRFNHPAKDFVYDASFVKLREVALSYALPQALMSRMGIKGADISIVGRNLWIIHKNLPDADPEDSLGSGNLGLGYQSGAYPTTRTLGANLRLSF